MRTLGIVVLLLLLAGTGAAEEDEGWMEGNARNRRWDRAVIEYVRTADDRVHLHVRNLGTSDKLLNVTPSLFSPNPLGFLADWFELSSGESREVELVLTEPRPSGLDLRGIRSPPPAFGKVWPEDSCPVPPADALSVALLVERRTFEDGNRRFGSFVRRMRKSFEDLHALFDDTAATTPDSILPRQAIRTRFRIQHVEVYDREEGVRPPLFDAHPDVDLVIACDEGGPLAGFWLPQYSIGHNFLFGSDPEDGSPRQGLWSGNGEQALWIDGQLWRKDGQPVSYLGERFPRGAWVWDSFLPDSEGEPFEGFRWRRRDELNLNFLWLLLYITKAPPGHISKVWFDDIVVAQQYIGPIRPLVSSTDQVRR